MKDAPHIRFNRPLFIGLSILLGICHVLMPSPAQAAPTVDQAPLTVQQPVPPNITLMLDDSGSMNWDFMPDASYLNGAVTAYDENGNADTYVNIDALRNSTNNGVYYNSSINYTSQLPPTVSGGTFSASPGMASAYADGFLDQTTSDEVNVTQFNSASLCDYNNYSTSQSGYYSCPNSLYYGVPYFTAFPSGGTSSAPTQSCNSGDSLQSNGMCLSSYYGSYYVPTPSCPRNQSYNYTTGWCATSSTTYTYYFTFTTGSAAGPYTRHYIGATGTCSKLSTANQAVCDETSTTQNNLANWFSYYRTRILMTKSGLMTAFSTLSPNVRLGYGSIDGNNATAIKKLTSSYYTTYTDNYNNGKTGYIATVQPFDQACVNSPTSPCTPGSSTTTPPTQRYNFWNWILNESAGGGTPTRQALNAVGQYYMTAGPWQDINATTQQTEVLNCRQSYAIVSTDGFWNDSWPYTGSGVGNADGTNGPTITGPNGQSYTYNATTPLAPFADSNSNTLADVAMYYWEHDLLPTPTSTPTYGLNEVPTNTADPAFWQHMTTFTMGLGFSPQGITPAGTTVPQIFTWADGGTAVANWSSSTSWPTPSNANGGSIYNITDLAHAAVDGHGGFYSATSPQVFASGIQDALSRAQSRAGTGASLAANSTTLQLGTTTYQSLYYTGTWVGDLQEFTVNPSTGAVAQTPTANAYLAMPAPASRKIWTYNPTATSGNQYVQFTAANLSSLSTAEQTALGVVSGSSSSTTSAQNLINYLLGSASLEQSNNGPYRNRQNTYVAGNPHDSLGDIVDSQPVFVGAPNANLFNNTTFSGSSAYSGYASTNATRAQAIWVAANDGMLHAFSTSTPPQTTDLAELFAYLPAAVLSLPGVTGISSYSNPAYGTSSVPHEDFNDGQLGVADAYVTLPGATAAGWRTILVGTTGRGLAKAVYAFDVTTPSSPTFLWERYAADGNTSDGNSGYIGQMTGQPVIAQTANGTWSVLIGNGYNSANGTAALLQFNLMSGALTVYQTNSTTGNGLAGPAVWISNPTNDISTMAYAGDILGNVWSFNLANGTVTKQFIAKASGSAQPITSGMLIGQDPNTANVWLYFGTGQYLTQGDISNTATQTWYGIVVQSGTSNNPAVTSGTTTSTLVQRTITAETAVANNNVGTRTISSAAANDMNGKSGWYLNLTSPTLGAQGERMVVPNEFQGNVLVGTTLIPVATDPCNPGGSGWIMAISPFTGGSLSTSFFPSDSSSAIGFSSVPNDPIFVGNNMLTSFNNASINSIATSATSGALQRQSWREMLTH